MYVGNLDYNTTDKELEDLFSQEGTVTYSKVITRMDGKSRGFGFVEMATKSEAEAAITGINGKTLKERTVVVNEARPRTDNRSGGSYGDRRGSGYGGGRSGGFGGGRQGRY